MRKIAMTMCLLSLVFAACGKSDSPTIDDALPKPTAISVAPVENNGTYGFNVPASVTVDHLAAITLDNTQGKEPHQAALLKLADGKTVQDAQAFLASTAPPTGPPPFTVGGGTTVVDPGAKTNVTQTLPAGTYAFMCFVPDASGAPHFAKGMVATVTVTGNSTTSLPLPDGENSTAKEYGYSLPSLKAGSVVLRATNEGKQDHEYQFAALADGKTSNDALAWLNKPQGPPPFSELGGPVVGVGGSNSIKLTLKKGSYVVFCRIPDQTDQKPHYAHGMFQGFSVT
jgi:plastocyanin